MITIFIGSGEASILERKTLIYSILKHTDQSLIKIKIFNGTHNTIEDINGEYLPAPMPLNIKYRNVTEFSNYRFFIPDICEHSGTAIWLDSDMLCLGDITKLPASLPNNYSVAALPAAYGEASEKLWGLSVSVFNCSKYLIDPLELFEQLETGDLTYKDIHQFTPALLDKYPLDIVPIDPCWNSFDYIGRNTKIVHYTNLYTQPWKAPGHPYGRVWFNYFKEALKEGFISKDDVELSILRSYVRPTIMSGNSSVNWGIFKNMLMRKYNHMRQLIKSFSPKVT